jgi:hypothetical protein
MTITYVDVKFGIEKTIKVPKLHRVVYGHTFHGVPKQWQISYRDYRVNQWLEDNCQHPYYHSPGYLEEKFIEFECDQDAMMFALRWA